MRRPTYFLSSTIFDLSDLRGAIKYHLEQRGCRVLASDFNDFKKPLDVHSYEACLRCIEEADYFVLLIGCRVGGWFDEQNRISITQQEYRTAYRLHQSGRIKLLIFVRREVWNFRETHKALERHLRSIETASTANAIRRYPNKFADDASFIIGFIEEVGRYHQTKEAIQDHSNFPTGNWIHVFSTFHDIADVLDADLLGGLPVEEAAFRRALRHELIELLGKCLIKFNGRVFGPRPYVEAFRREFIIYEIIKDDPEVDVPTKAWDRFATVMMGLFARDLRVFLLPQALTAPTFLEFDSSTGKCRETPVFNALCQLDEEVRLANHALAGKVMDVIFATSPKARGGITPPTIAVPLIDVAALMNLSFRWVNIVELSKALVFHLDGGTFRQPSLMPRSPVEGYDAKLAAESATADEVITFVDGDRSRE